MIAYQCDKTLKSAPQCAVINQTSSEADVLTMGVNCQILIQRPREGVHKAGRPVIGVVRYSIDEPAEYKDIILSLVGKGECCWTENQRNGAGRHNNHRQNQVTYRGTEVFVANYIRILNKQPGFTAVVPVGTYEYQFQFILPENIPPSFKDSACTISYKIGLKFEKASFFSFAKKFTAPINVYSCVRPQSPEGAALFGLDKSLLRPFSRRNHIINVKANISSTLYSPGQNADILYTVTNNTDVKITSIKTELVCYTTYTANCGRRREHSKIINESSVETPSIPPDAIANMSSIMPIQAHLYSIQSRIMNKEYKVKVTLRLPVPYINASVELPIVIGEKREDRNTEVAYFARPVAGADEEAVEGSRDGPPSYWTAMSEEFDKDDKGNPEMNYI